MSERLAPILTFGPLPQELADLRFTQHNGALVVDLHPRDVYYAPPSRSPSDAEKAIQDMGAHRVVPSKDYLRLSFHYIDGLVYCGPDESADVLTHIPDRDSGPTLEGQDWPYPLLKVESSKWAEHMMGPIEHYRIVGPFFTLDILGYEPEGKWYKFDDMNTDWSSD
ncbi:MAG: hypothetical protein CMK09_15560 [Ponticaulis sp.]|nr:hypothetical protein [Ponticaulis sp.]|tara:strand:- start:2146 stop:2643 length:498 start_codon:yes stop_codon:yes gene_type:complete